MRSGAAPVPPGRAPASRWASPRGAWWDGAVTASGVPTVAPGEIPPAATLLDVRETPEWVGGHAPEAVHLPMSELVARLAEVPPGPIAVVCKVGGRSAQVTAYLARQGHDVVNVGGGMLAWEAEGRPMVAEGAGPPRVV